MDKKITVLDGGTIDERIAEMKEFLGLSPEQSFQDFSDKEQNTD